MAWQASIKQQAKGNKQDLSTDPHSCFSDLSVLLNSMKVRLNLEKSPITRGPHDLLFLTRKHQLTLSNFRQEASPSL